MADKWYVIRGTMRLGPLGFPELQSLVAGGKLSPADVVQGVGGGPPQPAGAVPGLFPQAAPTPMPTPAPAYPGAAPFGGSGAMRVSVGRWFSFVFMFLRFVLKERWCSLRSNRESAAALPKRIRP